MLHKENFIEVISSPELYKNYSAENNLVIVVDAIRASATIATALHYGAEHIIPVETIEEAQKYKTRGYFTAGERDTRKLPECDFGNSPYEFTDEALLRGSKIALTTTNGTIAIKKANGYSHLFIGGFINHNALLNRLIAYEKNITILCSGWKMTPSIEDIVFAGKLAEDLAKLHNYIPKSDSANIARNLYQQGKSDLYSFILQNSPRLEKKEHIIGTDIRYCVTEQNISVVPELKSGKITSGTT